MDIYIYAVFTPILALLDDVTELDFEKIIPLAIDRGVQAHRDNKEMHNTLHSLSTQDELVLERFSELEQEVTQTLSKKLVALGYPSLHLYEKVHTAISFVQSFAHEEVYDHHDYIDYDEMRRLVTVALIDLFR